MLNRLVLLLAPLVVSTEASDHNQHDHWGTAVGVVLIVILGLVVPYLIGRYLCGNRTREPQPMTSVAVKPAKAVFDPQEKNRLFALLKKQTAECHEAEGDDGTYEALLKTKNKIDNKKYSDSQLTSDDKAAYDAAVVELEISGDLQKLKKLVLNLNQGTVAELKGYSNPPPNVVAIMGASYVLLGAEWKDVDTWAELQILLSKLGKESVMRRLKEFRLHNVTDKQAELSAKKIAKVEAEDDIADSCGLACAAFYAWSKGVLAERVKLQEQAK